MLARAEKKAQLASKGADMGIKENGELSINDGQDDRLNGHDPSIMLSREEEEEDDELEEKEMKNSAIKLNPSSCGQLADDDALIELSSLATSGRGFGGAQAPAGRPIRVPLLRVLEPDGAAIPVVIDEGGGGERAEAAAVLVDGGGRRRGASAGGKDGQELEPAPTTNRNSTTATATATQDGKRLLLAPFRWSSRRRTSLPRRASEQQQQQQQEPPTFHIITDPDSFDEQSDGLSTRSSLSRQSIGPTSNIRLSPYLNRKPLENNRKSSPSRLSFRQSITLLRSSSWRLRNRMASGASTSTQMTAQPDPGQVGAKTDEPVPSSFLRTDSIIIRIKPGQCFSDYSNVVMESPARCDPRLGTLGELQHHLQTGTKQQVKRFLRQNNWTSGHRIRAELWKVLCHDNNSDAQRAVYRDIVEKLGTVQTRPTFLTAPGVVLCDHQLKENGRLCLLRLLTAVEHQRPDFTYVPVLYPLGALFLHYMSEEEAFACIMNLISQSQKFLIQTDIATAASKRTMLVLVKKHVNRAYTLCKRLTNIQDDKDLVAIFDDWKSWIFRDLPFSHLVRVVDCFLFEGQKVLFRVALAILQLWSADRTKTIRPGKTMSAKELASDIADYCKTIKVQPPKLLKTAFGIRNLKMSTVRRLQQQHEMNLRQSFSTATEVPPVQKQSIAAHHYIDVQLDSGILSQNQAMQLISWIPSRYQLQTPCKVFSTDEDGTSFTRLWQKVDSLEPTVILIRTSTGEVFGAFCSEAWDTWKRQSGMSYFGTGETFLFRFPSEKSEGEKFSWVGNTKSSVTHSEELFQAADMTTLVVGGGNGEGLSIRQSLESGTSSHCATFDNPMLSKTRDFEIQTLEAFGFV